MSFYSISPVAFAGNGNHPMAGVGFSDPQSPTPSTPQSFNPYYGAPSGLLASQMPAMVTTADAGSAPASYTLTPEDVQEITTPLPLPSQLPSINLTNRSPTKLNLANVVAPVVPANANGLVLNTSNPPQRTGTFVLPPSVIIRTNNI